MNDLQTYIDVKSMVIGIVFGIIALSIILGAARWYVVRRREGTGPATSGSAIPLAITRRAPWRTNRRQDTARSEGLPAYGDTQNTTIVAPGDPVYAGSGFPVDTGSPLNFSANLSTQERIQKARTLLGQAKLHVSSAPQGGYPPGSLEALRIAELQRAVGLLMSVEAEKASSSPPAFEEGRIEAVRSSGEGARVSTACTQGYRGVFEEVETLLDQMESVVPTAGAGLDESQSAKMLELRRRVVELLAVDDNVSQDLPPQYIPSLTQAPLDSTQPSPA